MVYEEIAANMLEFAKNIIAYANDRLPNLDQSLLQLIEVKDYPLFEALCSFAFSGS